MFLELLIPWPPQGPSCLDQAPAPNQYLCTMPRGHKGKIHVAHNAVGTPIAVWGEAPASRRQRKRISKLRQERDHWKAEAEDRKAGEVWA